MKNTIFIVCILLVLFCLSVFSQAQTTEASRGVGVKNNSVMIYPSNGSWREVKMYDNSYAFVVGMSKYKDWTRLDGPVKDVQEVKSVLSEHGFNVQVEMDLTGDQLESKINQFIKNYGLSGNNRLIFYFAGHGETLIGTDQRDIGYFVPIDAPTTFQNEEGFKKTALSMDKIEGFAREIQTKHALFIFDSCFSGKLLSFRSEVIPPSIGEFMDKPARQFITSGSAKQKVPDESKFRKTFVNGLRGDGDTNRDGYVTGEELANHLKIEVTNSSERSQTPLFGSLQNASFTGDMVFFLSNAGKENDEDTAWKNAVNQNSVQSYTVYINSFRNGRYFQNALQSLVDASIKAQPQKKNEISTVRTAEKQAVKAIKFEFQTLKTPFNGGVLDKTNSLNDSFDEDLGEGIKIKLVRISGGKFSMGSNRVIEETPVREVSVNEFYMGAFEITQKQWEKVAKMEKVKIDLPLNPAVTVIGENLPAVAMSWEEAEEFCKRLSVSTGRIYALPTEAEWEYAARAETETPFFFGSKISSEIVNFDASKVSIEGLKGTKSRLLEVGSLKIANKFGLFDMHGNAAEWCEDGWEPTYEKAPTDGSARIGSNHKKVIRGGSYDLAAKRVCSTCRSAQDKNLPSELIGLRVVMRSPIFLN